ncbi:MAG: hypothetical protein WC777_04555 [Candidatus Gracilibacteria bacterium]|jgi:hypothetical protein
MSTYPKTLGASALDRDLETELREEALRQQSLRVLESGLWKDPALNEAGTHFHTFLRAYLGLQAPIPGVEGPIFPELGMVLRAQGEVRSSIVDAMEPSDLKWKLAWEHEGKTDFTISKVTFPPTAGTPLSIEATTGGQTTNLRTSLVDSARNDRIPFWSNLQMGLVPTAAHFPVHAELMQRLLGNEKDGIYSEGTFASWKRMLHNLKRWTGEPELLHSDIERVADAVNAIKRDLGLEMDATYRAITQACFRRQDSFDRTRFGLPNDTDNHDRELERARGRQTAIEVLSRFGIELTHTESEEAAWEKLRQAYDKLWPGQGTARERPLPEDLLLSLARQCKEAGLSANSTFAELEAVKKGKR